MQHNLSHLQLQMNLKQLHQDKVKMSYGQRLSQIKPHPCKYWSHIIIPKCMQSYLAKLLAHMKFKQENVILQPVANVLNTLQVIETG